MEVMCSYCGCHIGSQAPWEDHRVSHGMCEECLNHYERQIEGLPLDRYLDGFDAPVMIVDGEGRTAAANEMAATMCGKPQKELVGLLGGEAMECAYARRPGGCGKTEHCEACTIRNAVTATVERRKGLAPRWVKLRRETGDVQMQIATRYFDGIVRIVVNPA